MCLTSFYYQRIGSAEEVDSDKHGFVWPSSLQSCTQLTVAVCSRHMQMASTRGNGYAFGRACHIMIMMMRWWLFAEQKMVTFYSAAAVWISKLSWKSVGGKHLTSKSMSGKFLNCFMAVLAFCLIISSRKLCMHEILNSITSSSQSTMFTLYFHDIVIITISNYYYNNWICIIFYYIIH